MLNCLNLKNFALFKDTEIEFQNKMNILVGETGSGKSLIFDAILFILGGKADKGFIRTGESSLKVEAQFDNISSPAKTYLSEYDCLDNELVITRTLNDDGRSSCRVNGTLVTVSMLKHLGKLLFDSLLQHESVELLQAKNHLLLLDKFGKGEILKEKEILKQLFNRKKEINIKLDSLGGDLLSRERKKDLLNYQIAEIESADLEIGEDEEIKERIDLLANSEKLCEAVSFSQTALSEGGYSAIAQINNTLSQLAPLTKIDAVSELHTRLSSLKLDIEDISSSLYSLGNGISFDEREFNKLDSRLDDIKVLKKKYGNSIQNILSFYDGIKLELEMLENNEIENQKYQSELKLIDEQIQLVCEKLTSARKKYAAEIENLLVAELYDLGMKNTAFKIKFEEKSPSQNGQDDVEFTFSANIGQDLKSVSKTASGGEISRLMLAIKNIFYKVDGVDSLLFDEVDSGISGEIGNKIALKLKNIANDSQIICISHLPQVASVANHFYLVKKEIKNNQTESSINILSKNENFIEIARLIEGDSLSDTSIQYAKELLKKNDI